MDVIQRGELSPDKKVLIMVHGRGASAEDILSLADHLPVSDFVLLAPQAPSHTWYPFSFLAPQQQNEPHLSSSLKQIEEVVTVVRKKDIPDNKIFFLGFSQGACLTLEFTTRHARRWGGIIAFTGGLIGDTINTENYSGDFSGCPVYIGTSDPDPHVPVTRVRETEKLLTALNATVQVEVFQNMGHTISLREIQSAAAILSQK